MTSIKNNCLKLKSEVGMAVLKSNQTRVVGIISTYVVHPYACFMIMFLQKAYIPISVNKCSSITHSDEKSKRRDVLHMC